MYKEKHNIKRYDTAFLKIDGCSGCYACENGNCIKNDDMQEIYKDLQNAELIVFVSPIYYYNFSAQLKKVIDRFYAINEQIHIPKKAVLIITYADTSATKAQPIISHYETMLNYLGWSNAGQIIAPGVWMEGAVNSTQYPQKAYELGKNI